jgi:hypothetical protein
MSSSDHASGRGFEEALTRWRARLGIVQRPCTTRPINEKAFLASEKTLLCSLLLPDTELNFLH